MDKKINKKQIPAGEYEVMLCRFTNQARWNDYVAIVINNKNKALNGKAFRIRINIV